MMKCMAIVTVLAVILCLFSGCQVTPSSQTPLTRQTFALDTLCSVTLYTGQSEQILDDCAALLSQKEALWSKTIDTSVVSRLNASGGAAVYVDADTIALLQTSVYYSELTGGAFDVTTAPLTDCWKAAEQNGIPPTDEALASALASVGFDNIAFHADGAVILQNGAMIDLGGIAKGQIADDLVALLKDKGCTSGIIELGGNVAVIGSKPDGSDFHIGIAHPQNDADLIATVAVSDCSVVTSGSYERGYTFGDTRYSHILDPATGRPVQNNLLSVTVIAPRSADADALSTACFVMGYERAAALLETFDEIEAVFVKADGSVVVTDGVTLV